MTRASRYTPPIWRVAAFVMFAATMGLADVWLIAWLLGSIWGVAIAAGTIIGLMISIAWAIRHYHPAASIGGLVIGAALASAVATSSPRAAVLGVIVALVVFGMWCLGYEARRLKSGRRGPTKNIMA
jgi:hypothetical protein